MIIVLALIESLVIYALLISLAILFGFGLPHGDAVMAALKGTGGG